MACADRGRAGLPILLATLWLVTMAVSVRGADEPPAPQAPARARAHAAWRDPEAVKQAFEAARAAVEAACEAKFASPPGVRVSTREDVISIYEKERLAQLAGKGLGKPLGRFFGTPHWLVHFDLGTNVVHVVPEQADDEASDPDRAVLGTEAALRLLLVDELVGALDAERFPARDDSSGEESSDAAGARDVVRWAHLDTVMTGVAVQWGLSEDLQRLRRVSFGSSPGFAHTAGVAFLTAVRSARGHAGVETVLRNPPPSTRVIERPELWLRPEESRGEIDLDALLSPARDLVADPLWSVHVMRPLAAARALLDGTRLDRQPWTRRSAAEGHPPPDLPPPDSLAPPARVSATADPRGLRRNSGEPLLAHGAE